MYTKCQYILEVKINIKIDIYKNVKDYLLIYITIEICIRRSKTKIKWD